MTIKYNYHVFGLSQGEKESEKKYVAEGPSDVVDLPLILSDLEDLAEGISNDHLEYLKEELSKRSFEGAVRYMGFSFTPSCDNVIHNGEIYSTRQLAEDERKTFLEGIKKQVDAQK